MFSRFAISSSILRSCPNTNYQLNNFKCATNFSAAARSIGASSIAAPCEERAL